VAGSFVNTGQYCCGTERVYVVESVADEFTQKAVERTSKLRQATEGDSTWGALHSRSARNRGNASPTRWRGAPAC
jgi:acyl-CoA reductase-like NAD-dependent aldehyde dehydrogenase